MVEEENFAQLSPKVWPEAQPAFVPSAQAQLNFSPSRWAKIHRMSEPYRRQLTNPGYLMILERKQLNQSGARRNGDTYSSGCSKILQRDSKNEARLLCREENTRNDYDNYIGATSAALPENASGGRCSPVKLQVEAHMDDKALCHLRNRDEPPACILSVSLSTLSYLSAFNEGKRSIRSVKAACGSSPSQLTQSSTDCLAEDRKPENVDASGSAQQPISRAESRLRDLASHAITNNSPSTIKGLKSLGGATEKLEKGKSVPESPLNTTEVAVMTSMILSCSTTQDCPANNHKNEFEWSIKPSSTYSEKSDLQSIEDSHCGSTPRYTKKDHEDARLSSVGSSPQKVTYDYSPFYSGNVQEVLSPGCSVERGSESRYHWQHKKSDKFSSDLFSPGLLPKRIQRNNEKHSGLAQLLDEPSGFNSIIIDASANASDDQNGSACSLASKFAYQADDREASHSPLDDAADQQINNFWETQVSPSGFNTRQREEKTTKNITVLRSSCLKRKSSKELLLQSLKASLQSVQKSMDHESLARSGLTCKSELNSTNVEDKDSAFQKSMCTSIQKNRRQSADASNDRLPTPHGFILEETNCSIAPSNLKNRAAVQKNVTEFKLPRMSLKKPRNMHDWEKRTDNARSTDSFPMNQLNCLFTNEPSKNSYSAQKPSFKTFRTTSFDLSSSEDQSSTKISELSNYSTELSSSLPSVVSTDCSDCIWCQSIRGPHVCSSNSNSCSLLNSTRSLLISDDFISVNTDDCRLQNEDSIDSKKTFSLKKTLRSAQCAGSGSFPMTISMMSASLSSKTSHSHSNGAIGSLLRINPLLSMTGLHVPSVSEPASFHQLQSPHLFKRANVQEKVRHRVKESDNNGVPSDSAAGHCNASRKSDPSLRIDRSLEGSQTFTLTSTAVNQSISKHNSFKHSSGVDSILSGDGKALGNVTGVAFVNESLASFAKDESTSRLFTRHKGCPMSNSNNAIGEPCQQLSSKVYFDAETYCTHQQDFDGRIAPEVLARHEKSTILAASSEHTTEKLSSKNLGRAGVKLRQSSYFTTSPSSISLLCKPASIAHGSKKILRRGRLHHPMFRAVSQLNRQRISAFVLSNCIEDAKNFANKGYNKHGGATGKRSFSNCSTHLRALSAEEGAVMKLYRTEISRYAKTGSALKQSERRLHANSSCANACGDCFALQSDSLRELNGDNMKKKFSISNGRDLRAQMLSDCAKAADVNFKDLPREKKRLMDLLDFYNEQLRKTCSGACQYCLFMRQMVRKKKLSARRFDPSIAQMRGMTAKADVNSQRRKCCEGLRHELFPRLRAYFQKREKQVQTQSKVFNLKTESESLPLCPIGKTLSPDSAYPGKSTWKVVVGRSIDIVVDKSEKLLHKTSNVHSSSSKSLYLTREVAVKITAGRNAPGGDNDISVEDSGDHCRSSVRHQSMHALKSSASKTDWNNPTQETIDSGFIRPFSTKANESPAESKLMFLEGSFWKNTGLQSTRNLMRCDRWLHRKGLKQHIDNMPYETAKFILIQLCRLVGAENTSRLIAKTKFLVSAVSSFESHESFIRELATLAGVDASDLGQLLDIFQTWKTYYDKNVGERETLRIAVWNAIKALHMLNPAMDAECIKSAAQAQNKPDHGSLTSSELSKMLIERLRNFIVAYNEIRKILSNNDGISHKVNEEVTGRPEDKTRIVQHFMETFKINNINQCIEAIDRLKVKMKDHVEFYRNVLSALNVSAAVSPAEILNYLSFGRTAMLENDLTLQTSMTSLDIANVLDVFQHISIRLNLPPAPKGQIDRKHDLENHSTSSKSTRSSEDVEPWASWKKQCIYKVDLLARLVENLKFDVKRM